MKTNLNVDTQALREKILDLAMRGKLVKQDAGDEPASVLLEKIKAEKAELVKEGKTKKSKKLPEITDDEKPFDIPDSWEWVRLGDIVTITSGRDLPKAMHLTKKNGSAIPYITGASNIVDGTVTASVWTDKPVTVARKGDILLTVKGTVGKIAVLDVELAHIARQIMAISSISNKINQKYIILFLQWYVSVLRLKASGMIPGVTREDVSIGLIPLPPLADQKRIADKVSKLFNQVDVIEKNVAEYQDLEKAMRSKILELAMRGKLVEQDPSDKPASELLKQIQAEKAELVKEGKIKKSKKLSEITDDEKPFDIPDSWEWVKLENVAYTIGNKKNQIKESNVEPSGKYKVVSQSQKMIIGYTDDEDKVLKISKDCLVFGDHTAIVKYVDFDFVIGADGVKIFECLPGMYTKYLFYAMSYNLIGVSSIKGYSRHYKYIKEKLIPLPPLAEQKRIADNLTKLFEDLDTIKQNLATVS